jgi:hypothetical protein
LGILAGRITRTYRSWKRPQASEGGRYKLPPEGTIEVQRISRVGLDAITDAEARAAGFDDHGSLLAYLHRPANERVYLVEFSYLDPGRLPEPDKSRLDSAELAELRERLQRMDQRSKEAWTGTVLQLIHAHPGRRAADLAPQLSWDTATFKRQVRKLKALGLTISLETGYQLSSRGEQVVQPAVQP